MEKRRGRTPRFEPGDRVLLLDARERHYLITLKEGSSFHFHRGIVQHDDLVGEADGSVVRANSGEELVAFKPTLADYVLKMPRGAQVVYPKDLAAILVAADIFPGATVVEAGVGSGALSMALMRAVGPQGQVISYETREDFAKTAESNIRGLLGESAPVQIKLASIIDGIEEPDVDRVILDLPEPWKALAAVEQAIRPGGIVACYLPTVPQIQRLVESFESGPWKQISTSETFNRGWHIQGRSVRPEHRMVGHTGFVISARRFSPI